MTVLLETDLPLPLWRRGKVRDVYDLGDKLLVVATDRISALDVVLPCGIPDKGKVLNQLSAFWFKRTGHIVPNHFVKAVDDLATLRDYHIGEYPDYLIGRSMIVRKTKRIPVECIVRGYLFGSAWAEYEATGATGTIRLPPDMKEGQELPRPLFTPTTKSETEHDRPLDDKDVRQLGIENLMRELEGRSLLIYHYAQNYAKTKGIIIADTKLEFGLVDGELMLIDELLTPDSSRFWDASQYEVGHSQPCLDKQPVRDWLLASEWDKESPPPMLPQEVIEGTSKRYREAHSKLTRDVV
ncbi:MAG: phosphoribosylaminoimidazolesuccinocarboxamide synthase [Dehalococcoidia bacterium]|nr:MAG: phosphoribosylaminoimidazolesuccinocarboxamide synthase [Dehalococcoidia bacterium]